MARSGRPASESYQPACSPVAQSASYSNTAGHVGPEDEDDRAPIFSLSKSSMDVVMATGPPCKRDPAWTAMDLKRSSSTNTHNAQNSATLKKPHPRPGANSSALTTRDVSVHNPAVPGERRTGGVQRWSACSDGSLSRSSTPDTMIWKAGNSRPSSLTQDASFSAAPESPLSKVASQPSTPSPFISPLHTPTSASADLSSSASSLTLSTNEQEDLLSSLPGLSPVKTPNCSSLPSDSPDLRQLTSPVIEAFPDNHLLSFQFPSPIPFIVGTADVCGSLDHESIVNDVVAQLHNPRDMPLPRGGEVKSPEEMFGSQMFHYSAGEETPGKSCVTGRGWKSPLVSSLSDSHLGDFYRSNWHSSEGTTKDLRAGTFREEGTMTSQLETVDVAVQTVSPIGSWWDLKRNTFTSNMDSHSILGSPPGSRLNLKSSVGSNSNLVSPSSSMFPASSGEEEEGHGDNPTWDVNSASSHDLERKRSCLKMQMDEMGRRSSMKQVQWDEEGVAWDVHGESVDPKVLSTAILKHLELRNCPQAPRKTSNKKKAPKPPLLSNVVKAITSDLNPPVAIITSSCMVEGDSEVTPEADGGIEAEEEGGGKKEETAGVALRISRADDGKEEEDEVYREEGTSHLKSPSHGSGQTRKKSVIRSLRPGWCGGSRKADD